MFSKVFGPPELQIVEHAYKLAREKLALKPFPDEAARERREQALRETLFMLARTGDTAETLCGKALEEVPQSWMVSPRKSNSRRGRHNGA